MNQIDIWSGARMTYVNHKGEPLCPAALAAKYARPRVKRDTPKETDDRSAATMGLGFVVTGYSPERFEEMRRQYDWHLRAHEESGGKHPGTPAEFENRWMVNNKPQRARPKPYEIRDAAEQCAEMMRRAGWQCVEVRELLKA